MSLFGCYGEISSIVFVPLSHQSGKIARIFGQIMAYLHQRSFNVVDVNHVTIVASGHGLFKNFWPMILGCILRTAGSSIICKIYICKRVLGLPRK